MDNKEEIQELNLDDILNEFHDQPEGEAESVELGEELNHLLEELPSVESMQAVAEQAAQDAAEAEKVLEERLAAGFTVPMEPVPQEENPQLETLEDVHAELMGSTPAPEHAAEEEAPAKAPVQEKEGFDLDFIAPAPIPFVPKSRLRELKKKLVAGPERRYYDLTEIGVGKVQVAIMLNILIVLASAAVAVLFAMGMVPENRLRMVIFSQVLGMLLSALLGSHQMTDGFAELAKGRFTINTMVGITFLTCCVDALFCFSELRMPCCAAFSMEMTMALWARCEERSTEMSQMDTMRKATRLNSLVKVEDYYGGKPGILRGEGQVEDFMNHYSQPSTPHRVQSVYCFVSLLLCAAIGVFAGIHHGISMALRIFSSALLVAVPASFFVSLTRPAAVLERRLHLVGTVLCGWQGVKGLCGKAVFPLYDEDLFPRGAIKLNGVKFYGDREPDEVIACTAALMQSAGGNLERVFVQLRSSRNCKTLTAENIQSYPDGGIGGEVMGESVLLGSMGFLKDMGVEIPEGTMVTQAVYAAIDGQLSAVYAITYSRMRSAAAGLVSLCASRKATPVMVCGDFMLTEDFLRSKFKVRTRRVVFPTRDVRMALRERTAEADTPALALTTRDELVSSAYAVSGARALRTASRLGVAIHMVGGILGMLIMLALAYLGSAELLTPTHILLYQLVWMIPGLLVTEWTRTV
ncbi:MAG: hypothetical protein IJA75_01415 [Oscillospiraceae bacterium]|nr:hypothetical protein [Oscillospiraceae bacterium]